MSFLKKITRHAGKIAGVAIAGPVGLAVGAVIDENEARRRREQAEAAQREHEQRVRQEAERQAREQSEREAQQRRDAAEAARRAEEQILRVVAIGQTGTGKSTLLSSISGSDNFVAASDLMGVTSEVKEVKSVWRNTNSPVYCVDTPGLADPAGNDREHIQRIVNHLKDKHVHAFLIVLNGTVTRLDSNVITMLRVFQELFGADMWKHAAVVFSRCDPTERTTWEENSPEDIVREIQTNFGLPAPIPFVRYSKDSDDLTNLKAKITGTSPLTFY
eukprot:TRINITY_DN7853_c0_g1_i2.p1 TRINITY_DN7853_c0_g1~~TRINITY_DN7853_c0_g1_i2.p1  ORF type:complete len:274 (-),score=45.29 TRINITY_DN7853_c0_g1_i2:80-901(-)